jgi:hypothetical protein
MATLKLLQNKSIPKAFSISQNHSFADALRVSLKLVGFDLHCKVIRKRDGLVEKNDKGLQSFVPWHFDRKEFLSSKWEVINGQRMCSPK